MSRTGPNLYELLKQAGSKPPPEEPTPDAGPATPPAAVQTPPPCVAVPPNTAAVAAEPPPTRVETPAASWRFRLAGLGERVLQVTYNTAAFVALGVVGALFLVYAIGVRVGRASPREPAPVASPPPAAPPAAERQAAPAPPSPAPVYTIRLMEWNARTSRDRTDGQASAYKLKTALERSQFAQVEVKVLGDRVVLNCGRFNDPNSAGARDRLAKLREFRMQRGQEPAFRGAGFVRIE